MISPAVFENLNTKIYPQAVLADYTTFQLGGACPYLINCETPHQLENSVFLLLKQKTPFILIGGGSNLVVSDLGVECCIIRYVSTKPLIEIHGNELTVSASTSLDALALFAAEHGLGGLNYASGIPGTVGGAVVGNAGAFGKQVGDVIDSVTIITRDGKKLDRQRENLGFTYRHSKLKETSDIVASVRFRVNPAERDSLIKERAELLALRASKHPDLKQYPCAGSFFRNIEPTSKAEKRQAAGWFLEEAGGKSLHVGGAKIFDKHANIIVKSNGCRAQDVYELSKLMQKAVKEKFGFDLAREVRFVGEFNGKPQSAELIW
jgi:UDP-N-acetylmuramate dehydrogenase